MGIDLSLDRVRQIGAKLGLLNPQAKVITVAGTNGKGSCVKTLESILLMGQVKCGSFTSPHIMRYNERIRIQGQEVTDHALCLAFSAIDEACSGEITLTYFEFNALAALWLFQRSSLDVWLLEVGLGGRLDAVNILDADIAVVTSVDIDHIEWLGDTRDAIGLEKVGICRSGKPVVITDPNPPKSILNYVKSLACPVYLLGDDGFDLNVASASNDSMWTVTIGATNYRFKAMPLPIYSVAAALQVANLIGVLDGLDVNLLQEHIENTAFKGRMQRIRVADRDVILDVAHNPAALAHLVKQLSVVDPAAAADRRFDVVIAMMADKNLSGCLSSLEPVMATCLATTIPDFARAAAARDIATALPGHVDVNLFENVSQALEFALKNASGRSILVTGSFYTVAAATEYLAKMG